MKTVTRIALAAAVIAACSTGGGPGTQPVDPAGSLRVTPDVVTLLVSDTVRFATLRDSGRVTGDSGPVSWTVSDSRVAGIEAQGAWWALVRALHQGTTTVTATDSGGTASAVLVVAGPANEAKLAFTEQPGNATAGAVLAPAVAVTIEDSSGRPVTGATNAVTVSLESNYNSGGGLSGTTTVMAVNGVATFKDLSIRKAGYGYWLTASSGTEQGHQYIALLPPANSLPFAITPAAPSQLAFTTQPNSTWEAQPLTPAVQVAIEDTFANVVLSATNAVTLAIGTNPSGGTLAGMTTVNAVGGVATFGNLGIDRAGSGYALVASAPGLTGATTTTFTITLAPASIIKVAGDGQQGCIGQWLNHPLVVQVNDRNNQPAAGVTVRWSVREANTTGTNGQASAYWMLKGMGTQTATASVTNVGSVTFVALASFSWGKPCAGSYP
jgi:hypothetical protein